MKTKTIITLILGIIFTGFFTVFCYLMKDVETIWLTTRIIGCASFVSLCMLVILGELKLLKPGFFLFKYHTSIGVFTVFLVILHFISAAFDNFKWGKNLSFTDYLGFTFTDKWLLFLSLGTLAAYLIILIAVTSAIPVIQKIGFKRWKWIHYLSYITFVMVFVHSLILGTDIKSNILIKCIFLVCSIVVCSLLFVRIIKAKAPIDGVEITLLAVLFILILSLTIISVVQYEVISEKLQVETESLAETQSEITTLENEVKTMQNSYAQHVVGS